MSSVRDIQRFREVHNGQLLKKLSDKFRIERVRYPVGGFLCVFTSSSGNQRASSQRVKLKGPQNIDY